MSSPELHLSEVSFEAEEEVEGLSVYSPIKVVYKKLEKQKTLMEKKTTNHHYVLERLFLIT